MKMAINEMRVNIKIQTLGSKTGCHFSSHCSISHIIANYTLRQPPYPPNFQCCLHITFSKCYRQQCLLQIYGMHNFLLADMLPTLYMGEGIQLRIWTSNSGNSFGGQCLNMVNKNYRQYFQINGFFL